MPAPDTLAGHALGVAGLLLMLWAAFGYSWRKSVRRRGPGAARGWLRAHVWAGLAGPLLVVLHSGLAFRGLAGVTTLLAMVVVASGAVGRWVYTALPRGVDAGVDDELARLDGEMAALRHADALGPEVGGATAVATRAAPAVEAQLRTLQRLREDLERRRAVAAGRARWRARLAFWWPLHVPVSVAMLVLALVHAAAALWFRP